MRRRLILAPLLLVSAFLFIAVPTTHTAHHAQQASQCVRVGMGDDQWAYACTP